MVASCTVVHSLNVCTHIPPGVNCCQSDNNCHLASSPVALRCVSLWDHCLLFQSRITIKSIFNLTYYKYLFHHLWFRLQKGLLKEHDNFNFWVKKFLLYNNYFDTLFVILTMFSVSLDVYSDLPYLLIWAARVQTFFQEVD